MKVQETKRLKFEIKRLVDLIGFNFSDSKWLKNLSDDAKVTLNEYSYDAAILSKRDIAMMLYSDQDDLLWGIIMKRKF
jgi:hypothetical protein